MSRWKNSTPEQKRKLIDNVQRWRSNKIQKLKDLFGSQCSLCGYNKCMRALEFHHLKPEEKSFAISARGRIVSWERMLKEAQKCILVCANCHREIESKSSPQHPRSLVPPAARQPRKFFEASPWSATI